MRAPLSPRLAVAGLLLLFLVQTALLTALAAGLGPFGDGPAAPAGQALAIAALAAGVLGGGLGLVALRRMVRTCGADRRALALAETALRQRDEFLGLVAHELKTPLTALYLELGAAGRHARRRGDVTAIGLVGRADRAAHRLGDLVSRLLAEARGEAEGLALEEVDLGDVARSAVDARQELFRRARCDVTVRADGRVTGRWDRLRLERALASLLSNAAKYGQGRPIEVVVAAEGREARLSVRDHGIGIAPERRASIFERFERAVSPRNYGGLGLGLWITRREATALGGSVSVDSRPGEGAVFTISLPAGPRRPAARRGRGRRRPPTASGPGRAGRALRWLAWRGRGC